MDGSIDNVVNAHWIHLIRKCLKESSKFLLKESIFPTSNLIAEIGEVRKLNKTIVSKKFMKETFKLYFEFMNMVLLPWSKKHIIATALNFYLMESLRKMKEINLPVIVLEHIRKIMTLKDEKHGWLISIYWKKSLLTTRFLLEQGLTGLWSKKCHCTYSLSVTVLKIDGERKESHKFLRFWIIRSSCGMNWIKCLWHWPRTQKWLS